MARARLGCERAPESGRKLCSVHFFKRKAKRTREHVWICWKVSFDLMIIILLLLLPLRHDWKNVNGKLIFTLNTAHTKAKWKRKSIKMQISWNISILWACPIRSICVLWGETGNSKSQLNLVCQSVRVQKILHTRVSSMCAICSKRFTSSSGTDTLRLQL